MYTISEDGDSLLIKKDGQPLLTPMMRPVRTVFRPLADRLLEDLATYGEDPSNLMSLVAFQYAMTDFFSVMPREELEHSIAIGLDGENDWTFNCPTIAPEPLAHWTKLFGTHAENAVCGKEWLASLTPSQLCAVYMLGRALRSVNIPYIVATTLNPHDVKSYAEEVHGCCPFVKAEDMIRYFENYLFLFALENPAGKTPMSHGGQDTAMHTANPAAKHHH